MKLLLMFSILLAFSGILFAEEPQYRILFSKKGTLHLKACEDRLTCSFSGTQILSGTYELGADEICDTGEENGCVGMLFYPDDPSILPHFEGTTLERIGIWPYRKAAQDLMGKALSRKVVTQAKRAIREQPPQSDFPKTLIVRGRATVVIGEYNMQIACDSLHALAKIVSVVRREEPILKRNSANKALH